MRRGATCLLLALAALGGGCRDREAGPADADRTGTVARAPGEIDVPFRNRWWHFYERGLSWADGGKDAQAEADFRQCLRLRQTDARLARTYGMHFVQCFAHRELGAVLVRQGRLDEAERELRLSLAQEPSAKADFLLQRIAALRSGAAAAVPAPAETAPRQLILASVQPDAATPTQVRITGQRAPGTELWSLDEQGAATRIQADATGGFAAEVALGSRLALGTSTGPDTTLALPLAVAPLQAAGPDLALDGPVDGALVADGRAWYRYSSASAAGLQSLEITDADGLRLASRQLAGLRSAGTLRLDLPAGACVLRFTLTDRNGTSTVTERHLEARPAPAQDRSLRAVALALPLQTPRTGALAPGDDARLVSALIDDGRFRIVDQRADGILARELSLVEAGYVDRATAAAAGRRLASRYVIAGTMARGSHEAECFLRLVHCDSGSVVASADAYAEVASSQDADVLFSAAAGRLRQVFPVIAGPATTEADGAIRVGTGSRAGAALLMRVHLFAQQPGPGARPGGTVEITEVGLDTARARLLSGASPAAGWGVGE